MTQRAGVLLQRSHRRIDKQYSSLFILTASLLHKLGHRLRLHRIVSARLHKPGSKWPHIWHADLRVSDIH